MFKFAHPEFLYLLILLPLLVAIRLYAVISRKRALAEYGDTALLEQLMPMASVFRQSLKFWILFAAFAISCIVLARPQFGTRQETVTRTGIETVIALDVSNSMMADDVAPSRLEKSKRIISNLVDQMQDDKIGLIVFAGDAFVQLPITSDFISAKVFLSSINPSVVARQGTDIKAAIDLAARSFTPNEGVGKAIIVITDGENHEGGAEEAAKAAADKGLVVHVMGIGSTSGSPIPGDRTGEFRKDKDGNVIITRLDDRMCQDIAAAGGGSYFYVDNTNAAEKALQKELDTLAKSDVETTVYTEFDEQFRIFAWIVLVLLALELFISERRNMNFSLGNIFKPLTVMLILLMTTISASAQRSDREYVRRGNRAFNDSAFVKAEEEYLRAIDANSASGQATYNLGNTYLEQQKAQEAAEEYQKAITIHELELKKLLESDNVTEKTIEDAKQRTAMAYHNLGVLQQGSQDYASAVESYKQALRNNPADQTTRYNLILAMNQLKNQQSEQSQDGEQDKEEQDQEQQENQNEEQQEQQQEEQQQPQQQENQEMSQENAEQLLQAVMQDEKDVQERVQQKMQVQPRRQLDKDW